MWASDYPMLDKLEEGASGNKTHVDKCTKKTVNFT